MNFIKKQSEGKERPSKTFILPLTRHIKKNYYSLYKNNLLTKQLLRYRLNITYKLSR